MWLLQRAKVMLKPFHIRRKIMNHYHRFFSLLAIAALALAACGSPTIVPTSEPVEPPTHPPPTTAPTAVPTLEPTAAPTPDPIVIVERWIEAQNTGDVEGALALAADNFKWRGTPTFSGKERLKAYLEGQLTTGYTTEISNTRVTANRVTYSWDAIRNNLSQAVGEDTIVIENGLIVSVESYAFLGSDSRPDIPEFAFTASDSGYTGPDEIQSGWVNLTLTNEGSEPHHIQLAKLDGNATPDDLKAALTLNPEAVPPFATFYGGPNAPDPGGTTSAIAFLPAGQYAMFDVIPDADGAPHYLNGFMRALTVTQYNGIIPGEPLPAATFDLADFSFTPSASLIAGEQMIRFVNKGTQPHEAYIVKLTDGKTAGDYLNTPPGEIPPAVSLGGITAIAPGTNQYVALNLEPGNYALFCFYIDPSTHTPHFAQGMMYEFTIE
jgi:hypothetical protein